MGVSMPSPSPGQGPRGRGPYKGSLEVRHSSFLTNLGGGWGRAGACDWNTFIRCAGCGHLKFLPGLLINISCLKPPWEPLGHLMVSQQRG